MAIEWYIEAQEGESWRQVNSSFIAWLQSNASLTQFGYSEGNAVVNNGVRLLCFSFPSSHGESIGLFEAWAKTTERIYGRADNAVLFLSNNSKVTLPADVSSQAPPWVN